MLVDATDQSTQHTFLSDVESGLGGSGIQEQSDLREFLVLLKRHVLLILLITLTLGAATYAASAREPKQYTSGATLLFSLPASSTQDPTRAIATVVGISGSHAVLAPVAKRDKLSFEAVKGAVTITGDPNADIIHIDAKAGSAVLAAKLANDVADALIAYNAAGQKHLLQAQISSLQHQLDALAGKTDPSAVAAAADLRTQLSEAQAQLAVATPELAVLSGAVTPTSASSPHPKRDALIGALAGLVLGILLSAMRDRLDHRVRAVDEVETLYHAPMLGMVPFAKGRHRRSEMLADFSGSEPLADAYRTIRANLALFRPSGETSVIVVTSAASDEGKSAVAANVAHALSVMGRNVLAVSADLHNPTLHEYFEQAAAPEVPGDKPGRAGLIRRGGSPEAEAEQVRPTSGLVEVLAGKTSLTDAVRPIPLTEREQAGGGSLGLLANKSTFFDPGALFSSATMRKFLKKAQQHYDVVIFDTPPLLANADAALLGQHADVLVLVARLDHLTKNQARRAVRIMSATRLTPTGVIVTGEVDESVYGYGYRHEAIEPEALTTAVDSPSDVDFEFDAEPSEPVETEADTPVDLPKQNRDRPEADEPVETPSYTAVDLPKKKRDRTEADERVETPIYTVVDLPKKQSDRTETAEPAADREPAVAAPVTPEPPSYPLASENGHSPGDSAQIDQPAKEPAPEASATAAEPAGAPGEEAAPVDDQQDEDSNDDRASADLTGDETPKAKQKKKKKKKKEKYDLEQSAGVEAQPDGDGSRKRKKKHDGIESETADASGVAVAEKHKKKNKKATKREEFTELTSEVDAAANGNGHDFGDQNANGNGVPAGRLKKRLRFGRGHVDDGA